MRSHHVDALPVRGRTFVDHDAQPASSGPARSPGPDVRAVVRSFRFACRATGGQARTAKEWCELALRAEDLGYDTFGVSDHFATAYAPLLVLQLVATCTSRLRMATLVLNNDFRHPAVLAKEAATLDLPSGGRLELGMGAGWQPPDYERSGIPYDPGRVRVERLRESLQVLKRLFGDGRRGPTGPLGVRAGRDRGAGDRALGDRARSYGDLVRIDSVGPDRRVRACRRNSPRSLTVATSGCGRT